MPRRPLSAPRRLTPSGFVAPCLPTLATRLSPSTWQTATVRESLPEPPAASRKRHSSCLARRQFVAAKDRHRVEHLTSDKSLEVASELREVLGTQVSFAPSKAVAGQHRTAGAVQSLTMSTQAIRDGEITARHAAAAIPRHIRAASPLLCRGAGLSKDR